MPKVILEVNELILKVKNRLKRSAQSAGRCKVGKVSEAKIERRTGFHFKVTVTDFCPNPDVFQRTERARPNEKAYINANCILFYVKPTA